jgi:hypothetical protein
MPFLRVIPAQAGIQGNRTSPALDPRFRGGDNERELLGANRHASKRPAPPFAPAPDAYQPPPAMRAFSSASNASTLALSMILVGTMISLFSGTTDLSPSRYFAISFMPS